MTFRVENQYISVLRTSGDRYLTSPPITHLILSLKISAGYVGELASLRVKDGIRLCDVADVLCKLCQNLPAECRSKPDSKTGCLDYIFDARIFCARQREFF